MLNWCTNLDLLTVTSTCYDSKVFGIKNVCKDHQHFSTLLKFTLNCEHFNILSKFEFLP